MPTITLTISSAKFQEFKDGFLKIHPITIPIDGSEQMTENEWISFKIKQIIQRDYARGKAMMAREENLNIDEEIII